MKGMFIILFVLISNSLLGQDDTAIEIRNDKIGSFDSTKLKEDSSKVDYVNVPENFINNNNPRKENPFGVNVNIGGPSILLSSSLDYFVTSSVNIEAGIGVLGLFGGIKYHLYGNKDKNNWTPYLGLFTVHIPAINLFSMTPARNGLYIPLGIQYLDNSGFLFGIEVAGITLDDIANGTPVWGAIKFGYHF